MVGLVIRPVDENGDIRLVASSSDLLRGVRAESTLVHDRLDLLSGEWWENLSWGNRIVEMLKETRFTEADSQVLASYLTSYIRETPGVIDVRDVSFFMEGRIFRYTCTIDTEEGSAGINYTI